MIVNLARAAALAAIIVSLGGCLVKDTTHTIYLSPSGVATWLTIEKDIRSVAESSADRTREEAEFLQQTATSDHAVARALGELAPTDLRSVLVRDVRPFAVLTEASFGAIDVLADRVVAGLGLRGRSTLVRAGGVTRWRLELDLREAEERPEEGLSALIEEVARYRVVLTDGRFVDMVGFRPADDHRTAVPVEADVEALGERGQPLVLELAWRNR